MKNYANSSVSVVIPVHNEEGIIGDLVDRVIQTLTEMNRDWEVLVVDDGSQDRTQEILQGKNIKLIAHPYNIGNGAATKTGIRHAKGEIIITMDGDGQHDPRDIPRLLSSIGPYDMVVGSRVNPFSYNKHRAIANRFYNLFASYVTHFPVKDLTSGFRAVKSNILKRYVYLLPNTFSYPTTLTLSLLRAGHSLKYESSQAFQRTGHSKIKLATDGFRFIMIIFKIATIFSPLKIFIPASIFFFLCGLMNYAYTYLKNYRFTTMSGVLITSGFLFFLLGLLSEQIAQMRFEQSEEFD
jgi:glycosyltransferase involved in cell wall biosynthesis